MANIYKYDTGKRCKHKWEHPYAGFQKDTSGRLEGKCPSTISLEYAEELLNNGIPASPPDWTHNSPKWIYNFDDDGVVYKAVITVPGVSYHGFPCPGPKAYKAGDHMTKKVQKRLLEKAEQEGKLQKVKRWFEEHP